MTKTRFAAAALAIPLAILAAGCGGGGKSSSGSSDVSGNVSMTGVWTGDEQKSFDEPVRRAAANGVWHRQARPRGPLVAESCDHGQGQRGGSDEQELPGLDTEIEEQ